MREQIDLGLTQISPKEYLEWMRGNEKRLYDRLLNEVLKTWMEDEDNDHTTEIIDLLSNSGDLNNDYRLVDYYDRNGEFLLGDLLLDVINGYPLANNQQEDLDNYTDYRNLIHQWKQNDVDMASLDSTRLAELESYVEMRYPVGARAMGLLFLNDALDYQEPLILPGDGGDKSNSGRKQRSSLQSDNVMILFPNPSSNYFTLDYSLRDLFNSGALVVIDANGKTVYQTEINYTRDQLLIATDNWPSGQYSCILLIDDKTMLSEKMTIIK